MKSMPNWIAAVALSAAVTSAVPAFGQAQAPGTIGGAQRAQQDDKQGDRREQREERREAQRDRQEQKRGDRAERRQENQEKEQLRNMPRPVRLALRGETANATNIDYFREKAEKGQGGPTFGATFTSAEGRNIDLRLDREGKVISRTDLTAQTASSQAPATPAPGQPAQPAPGTPATPAPGTTPAPTTPGQDATAGRKEAPPSGDPIYRRLKADEIPQNVRTVLDREAQGGKEIEYYRTKYGRQLSYTVSYNDPKGVEHDVYVSDEGKILTRHNGDEDDRAQAASGSQSGSGSPSATPAAGGSAGTQQYGRVELEKTPKQVQTQFARLTEGASNVKFYTTKYGQQSAFLADFRGKDGKQHKVYVDESGKILSQRAEGGDSK